MRRLLILRVAAGLRDAWEAQLTTTFQHDPPRHVKRGEALGNAERHAINAAASARAGVETLQAGGIRDSSPAMLDALRAFQLAASAASVICEGRA